MFFKKPVFADLREVIVDGLLGHVEITLGFDAPLFPAPAAVDEHGRGDRDHRNPDQGSGGRICERSVLAEPAAKAFEPALGISRHRLVGQPVLKVLGQVVHRVITRGRFQCHRLEADRFQWRWYRAVEGPRRREISLHDLVNHLRDILARKRDPAREYLVEGRTQAVNVAGRTELVDITTGLLGAHVRRRANRRALLGLPGSISEPPPESCSKGWSLSAGMTSLLPITLARPQSTTRVSP